MSIKNNVTRLLDAKKINYTPHVFPAQKFSALEVAEIIGVDPEKMYKTLVALRPTKGKMILAMVSGPRELNLKALAKAVGEKKIKLSTLAEAEKLTGLQTGGISPLALLQRGFQVILDASAIQHATIYISGGQRGLNIEINPQDLITLIQAKTADISRPLLPKNN